MIPFNFIYYRPGTLAEAAEAYAQVQAENREAIYYGGGSEVITMCRAGSIRPDAVIDLKHIPECRMLGLDGQGLHIGAACTLSEICMADLFPLLRLCCGRIADHSNQCRITLGGNLCGTIIYRETALALLVADAAVTLFGPQGVRSVTLASIFDGRVRLSPGEFIVQLHIPKWALAARCYHIKKTANEKIDYPLLSLAAIEAGSQLRVAISGICPHPFRSTELERVLGDRTKSISERAERACALLPEPALSTAEAGGEYRVFVLKNTLHTLLEEWENGSTQGQG